MFGDCLISGDSAAAWTSVVRGINSLCSVVVRSSMSILPFGSN